MENRKQKPVTFRDEPISGDGPVIKYPCGCMVGPYVPGTLIPDYCPTHSINVPSIIGLDYPNCGTAGLDPKDHPCGWIKFQSGNPHPDNMNGTTIEEVVEILIHRLRQFNNGPLACRENSMAIQRFEEGINWLVRRERRRAKQGILGSNSETITEGLTERHV